MIIYTISEKNIPVYVGMTSRPLGLRLQEHSKVLFKDKAITIEILDEGEKDDEIFWINQLTSWGFPLVNGQHRPGFTLSEEHKKAILKATIGRVPPQSERDKVSAYHKGRPKSAAHKAKLSKVRTGTKLSAEHKAKISEGIRVAHKNKKSCR